MSAFLSVISTRFPAVNHGLHVKDKRVRVFSSIAKVAILCMIGLFTSKYLGFLKLQFVPRFMGTGTCISPVPVNRNRGISNPPWVDWLYFGLHPRVDLFHYFLSD